MRYAASTFAPYKRIRRIEFYELPKTIGKIRRVELRARGGRGRRRFGSESDFPELCAGAAQVGGGDMGGGYGRTSMKMTRVAIHGYDLTYIHGEYTMSGGRHDRVAAQHGRTRADGVGVSGGARRARSARRTCRPRRRRARRAG